MGQSMGGKITALKQQARNPNRVSVYLDGNYAFGLSKILAVELREGEELDDSRVKALQTSEQEERAFQRAVQLIGRRPRSKGELRRYFEKNGFDTPIQERVLQRLQRATLVNDDAFAKAWVENQTTFRPRGKIGLKAELRKKGIDKEAIEAALEGFDEFAAAYKAAEKANRRWKQLSKDDYKRRLGGYLARRGFPYEMINEVTARLWRQVASHSDESEEDE